MVSGIVVNYMEQNIWDADSGSARQHISHFVEADSVLFTNNFVLKYFVLIYVRPILILSKPTTPSMTLFSHKVFWFMSLI
jgi:hypothetical protein